MKSSPRQSQGRKCKIRSRKAQNLATEPERSEGSEILLTVGKTDEIHSRNNPGDLTPLPAAPPFRDLSKQGRSLNCHPPRPLAKDKGDWLEAGKGRGAAPGRPTWGLELGGGRGERECQEKKKSRSFFLLISRQPRRVSGRARDFQRARRPGLSRGAWNPLLVPRRVPGLRLSQVVLGACKGRGFCLQDDPSLVMVVGFPRLRDP